MPATEDIGAVEVVRRCFEAWDRGDLEGVLAQYADDARVDASRIAEGVYMGKPAIRRFYAEIFESTRFTNDDATYEAVGDGVLVTTRLTGAGVQSGAPIETTFTYVFIVRDGAVRNVTFHPDEASARQALPASG